VLPSEKHRYNLPGINAWHRQGGLLEQNHGHQRKNCHEAANNQSRSAKGDDPEDSEGKPNLGIRLNAHARKKQTRIAETKRMKSLMPTLASDTYAVRHEPEFPFKPLARTSYCMPLRAAY
jgi:hypothetical protein